jgi:7-cyano-7-deazaguanine synthase in queuosine biosynthesis
MHIFFKNNKAGLIVNNSCKLNYPKKIWLNYPKKEKNFFIDNAAYSNTVCSPLVSNKKEIKYNTSEPFIKKHINESIINDIPSAVEDYNVHTSEIINQFKAIKYTFKDNKIKKPVFSTKTHKKAVIPFSCGKDSLLTLAVCNEIKLNPVAVYFNDTVSPSENKLKINYLKDINKKLGIKIEIVRNEIEKLNDFEFWKEEESVMGYSHMLVNFCMLSLPVNFFYNAKYLVLGNEHGLNSKFKNKDGIWCYPSYDQSFEGTKRLNKIFKKLSCSKIQVTSVVSCTPDLVMMKILHGRYKEFGKYQSSCACLDASRQKRWCCKCNDDIRFYVYMLAVGKDPKTVGINKNLLNKKFIKYHVIFNPKAKERYDKVQDNDQELKFAYYLAYKNGAKGRAIDLFKQEYLKEVRKNEDKLYKKYFRIYNTSLIPKEIRKDVISIYKEELK